MLHYNKSQLWAIFISKNYFNEKRIKFITFPMEFCFMRLFFIKVCRLSVRNFV